MSYTPPTIDHYLENLRLRITVTPELEKEIRETRTLDLMTPEQYHALSDFKVIKKVRKMKVLRSFFCKEDGTIVYFDSYSEKFEVAAYFTDAETPELLELREKFLDKKRKLKQAAKRRKAEARERQALNNQLK